mmetsp:Transcript_18450/g.62226  ORF Transcript_18450/g.62226 Transcript_18450/m.62226 type:complete len:229 (+) Transcript_18450:128-814(+)
MEASSSSSGVRFFASSSQTRRRPLSGTSWCSTALPRRSSSTRPRRRLTFAGTLSIALSERSSVCSAAQWRSASTGMSTKVLRASVSVCSRARMRNASMGSASSMLRSAWSARSEASAPSDSGKCRSPTPATPRRRSCGNSGGSASGSAPPRSALFVSQSSQRNGMFFAQRSRSTARGALVKNAGVSDIFDEIEDMVSAVSSGLSSSETTACRCAERSRTRRVCGRDAV